jgi:hypothetical protein
MSTMTAPPLIPTTPPAVFPALYRFTVAQFARMVQDGMIGKSERVELIEGLLVTKINLVDRKVEVHTQPSNDGYQSRQDYASDLNVPVMIEGIEVGRIPVSSIVP